MRTRIMISVIDRSDGTDLLRKLFVERRVHGDRCLDVPYNVPLSRTTVVVLLGGAFVTTSHRFAIAASGTTLMEVARRWCHHTVSALVGGGAFVVEHGGVRDTLGDSDSKLIHGMVEAILRECRHVWLIVKQWRWWQHGWHAVWIESVRVHVLGMYVRRREPTRRLHCKLVDYFRNKFWIPRFEPIIFFRDSRKLGLGIGLSSCDISVIID